MKETTFKYENVTVKIIDPSSHEERMERLKKPLEEYFKAIEREKYERKRNG